MPTKIYYQTHKESLLQKQRDFYDNNKELIKKQAKNRYHSMSPEEEKKRSENAKKWFNNLPEDKKIIKREYAKNRYHNMTDEQMQKHKEYQKNYQKMYREKKKQELEKAQGNLTKTQS